MRKHERIRCFVRDCIPDVSVTRGFVTHRMEMSVMSTLISSEDVSFGEKCLQNKKDVLAKYNHKLGRHLKKIEKDIENSINECARYQGKGLEEKNEIALDMQFCRIAYGFLPSEYVAFKLEEKGIEERKTYISDQQRRMLRYKMNDILAANVFINKYRTYLKYKDYYHRNIISISKKKDFNSFHQFIAQNDEFVLKNALDSLGYSVNLIKRDEIVNEKEFFSSCINKGIYVLEERIEQSNELSSFNRSSVNTVRIITVKTKKGIITPYSILRIGRDGAFVDNSGNGGIIACIDYETGKLFTDGYDETGHIFRVHPDTDTVFKGFQLPEWEELRNTTYKLAQLTDEIRMVGWDFAHTPNGWILVEGNDSPHIIAQQMILGGLQQTMKDLLEDM